jgi:hypothetical protein
MNCGVADGNEKVAFAGTGRPDQAQVLFRSHPFEGGEVVKTGLADRRDATSNWSRVLATGNPAVRSVEELTGRDLDGRTGPASRMAVTSVARNRRNVLARSTAATSSSCPHAASSATIWAARPRDGWCLLRPRPAETPQRGPRASEEHSSGPERTLTARVGLRRGPP